MQAAVARPRLVVSGRAHPALGTLGRQAGCQRCSPKGRVLHPLVVRAYRDEQAAERAARAAADRRHRMVADTSDDEAYLPSDADSDIPMSKRLAARDMYREMRHLPPEYPPEPEVDSPDKHLRVSDLASDEEEMLPDDPLDMDEELITDTKPFIADVYNETAGVLRKATTQDIARHSSRGPGASNMPPDAASRMSVGGEREPEGREQHMAEAEEEVTEMKQEGGGSGSTSGGQQGSHAAREVSAEEAAEAAEESMKEAGAGSMQPQVQGQVEEGQHQEEGEVSGHGSPEEHARRRAIEQMGGRDRPAAGQSLFLDKKEGA